MMEVYEGLINTFGEPRRDAVMIELINDAVIVHVECKKEENKERLIEMARQVLASDLIRRWGE